ncbi:MAG: segregation/condensation protein A [Gammaproteobacteria bacterium]|nr:MAG: segregation/condensation protein A [Gammaproteobacteria bacterium]
MSDRPPVQVAEALAPETPPLAVVRGEAVTELPRDLYIPPDALEVVLEAFEGPLDLLLYLIRRQNLDILDIPVAEITRQYMDYIALMKELRLEVAAEYLVMAAMLAEIKSRMLLPRPQAQEEEEEDPRAELVRRLQEYERYKQAAEDLDALPRLGRDLHTASAEPPPRPRAVRLPEVDLRELLEAFRQVLQRAEQFAHHQVLREPLSVRERMSRVLEAVGEGGFVPFQALFRVEEGRMGVVVTFLAILELVRESLLETIQAEPFGPLYLRARCAPNAEATEAADSTPEDAPGEVHRGHG